MGFQYDIDVQVDETVNPVGGFHTARAAAVAAFTESSLFAGPAGLSRTQSSLREAIEAGEKTIEVRTRGPRIVVVVS